MDSERERPHNSFGALPLIGIAIVRLIRKRERESSVRRRGQDLEEEGERNATRIKSHKHNEQNANESRK